jgi:hypothetical protein
MPLHVRTVTLLTSHSVPFKVNVPLPEFSEVQVMGSDVWLLTPLCIATDCLAKNGYNEEKCRSHVDRLYDCCNAFYQEKGDDAKTASCPKPRLLRLKMKQRSQGM